MKKRTVAVIGGGQMGRALVCGILASSNADPADVTVVDPSEESRQWWTEKHPDVSVSPQVTAQILSVDVVLLAVKPNLIEKVAGQVGQLATDSPLVVSIAAGIDLESLSKHLGHERVIRVMPNTPCLVGEGVSAFCGGDQVSPEDRDWISKVLTGVGLATEVDESKMDAVTGLSGSGPAYICLVIEAMADGGVLAGLPRPLAMQLAAQTVLGTAKMVMETGQHPGQLKDAVASPGGTTIAALQVLEDRGLRSALIGAVQASARRSSELS